MVGVCIKGCIGVWIGVGIRLGAAIGIGWKLFILSISLNVHTQGKGC
jgi:hypothetical protein